MGTRDLEVEVLGPVRAFVGDDPLAIGGSVDRAVLGMLAIRSGHRVAVTAILDALYPGVPRSLAKRSLQTAVWRLRRALGDHADLLVTDQDGYRLDVDAADLVSVRTACRQARDHIDRGQPDRAETLLSEALDRWRGRSPEMPRSVTGPADALVADVTLLLAEILLGQGRPEDARVHLERLLDDQPDLGSATSLLRAAMTRGRGGDDARRRSGVGHDAIRTMAVVLGRCSIAELRSALASWYEATAIPARAVHAVPDAATIVEALSIGAQDGLFTIEGEPMVGVSVRTPEAAADLLSRVPSDQILSMHHAAATGLQRLHGADSGPHLIAVSEHLLKAIPIVGPEVAVDALVSAAPSLGASDPQAAIAVLDRAAETLEAWLPDDVDRRLAVLLATGKAHDQADDRSRADRTWEEAVEVAGAHHRGTVLAEAALALAGSMFHPRPYERAGEMLELALSTVPADDKIRSLVILRRVQMERFGPGGQPLAHVNAAADRLILAGMSREDIAAQVTVAFSRWVASVEEGTATFGDDDDLAVMIEAAGDVPNLQLSWERWAITCAIVQGRFEDATAGIAALAPRIRRWTSEARTAIERDEFALARLAAGIQLATIRAAQGRRDEARALAEAEIARVGAKAGSPVVDLRIVLALHKARGGDHAGATDLLHAVLPTIWDLPIDEFRYATAIQSARVAAELGEQAAIDPLLAELEPWRGRHCVVGTSGYAGVTEQLLGRLRATRGDLDEADALFAGALAAHLRVGAPMVADISRLFRADVLQKMGGAARQAEADAVLAEIGQERLPDRAG